jgi:hypothetical protein
MLVSDARYEKMDLRRVRIPDRPREARGTNDTLGGPDSWSQLQRGIADLDVGRNDDVAHGAPQGFGIVLICLDSPDIGVVWWVG